MFRLKLFIIGLLGVSMFLISCDEDGTGTGTGTGGGTNANAPFVSIGDDGTGTTLTFDSTVEPGQVFRIQIDALANVAQLRAVEVLSNGFSLTPGGLTNGEFDNLQIDDSDEQNPQLLFGADKDALLWTFEFIAPADEGTFTYEFVVSDDDFEEISTILNVTVEGVLVVEDPTITLNGTTDMESVAGGLVQINVEAVRGTNEITSVSVWEDGALIEDLTRIRFRDADFEANPMPLFAPDTEGFTEGILVRAIEGAHDYVIQVTDSEGNNANIMFTISEISTGTALENTGEIVLFSNANGPSLGGLDLDNGVAVPSASGDAEIRDLGIDNGPIASNWLQQVEAVNDAELRVVNTSMLPDGFTFEGVQFKEEVAAAFNTGALTDPSPVLQVGDILAVSSPRNIYLMQVEEVNVTESDNEDFYRFSIKF